MPPTDEFSVPRVGVGVVVTKGDQVLVGKRAGTHGAGQWGLPGGYLELFESFEECARREVREECGIELGDVELVTVTNDVFGGERRHGVTIFVRAPLRAGEPRVCAPEEVERWEWHDLATLPEPRFLPLENLVRSGALRVSVGARSSR
jgi:8-oxo-dGTP diphosphatase